MLTAIVLIDTVADRIPEVADAVAEIPGVSEVYSVTGDIDLIAVVRVREHDRLAEVIADQVSKVEGIVRTQTYIAFRAYSRTALEQAFDLGLDDYGPAYLRRPTRPPSRAAHPPPRPRRSRPPRG